MASVIWALGFYHTSNSLLITLEHYKISRMSVVWKFSSILRYTNFSISIFCHVQHWLYSDIFQGLHHRSQQLELVTTIFKHQQVSTCSNIHLLLIEFLPLFVGSFECLLLDHKCVLNISWIDWLVPKNWRYF